MHVIVGTYRKRLHVERALRSLDEKLSGVSGIHFVDDSGDPEHSEWLRQYGEVTETGAKGYGAAMRAVCSVGFGSEAMFWEEDFTLLEPVNLEEISELLFHRPHLAQVALLRGPHFPVEHEHGGVLEALRVKGHRIDDVGPLWEQTATFTCNPSVWRSSVFQSGWPNCRWSEDRKRDELVRAGYRFGFLKGIRVEHDGERSGHGY